MSCGCGGLPPSITLRMRALELAVTASSNASVLGKASANEVVSVAGNYLRFLATDEQIKALDDAAAKKVNARSPDSQSQTRNALLQMQVESILRSDLAHDLRTAGVTQIGTLVQWFPHELRDHAHFSDDRIEAVSATLRLHGLQLGMSTDALREWIFNGKKVANG